MDSTLLTKITHPDAPFLITKEQVFTYADLLNYTEDLAGRIAENKRPIPLVVPEVTTEDVFTVAGYFLLGIPVLIASQSGYAEPLEFKDLAEDTSSSENQIVSWLFTSGTTAHAKCVPIRMRQIQAASRAAKERFAPEKGKAWLLTLPLYHVGGLSILYRSILWQTAVYLPPTREIPVIAELLENETRIQTASLVYTQWKRLSDAGITPHKKMKAILLGGGPIPDSFIQKLKTASPSGKDSEKTIPPLYNSYGMTETFAMIACRDLQKTDTLGNVGFLMAQNQIRVNQHDEIELKGPQVFGGYASLHNSAENFDTTQTLSSFTGDGWFRTGDVGRLEHDGSLTVLSRRVDRIVSGGKNITPYETESALLELPYIKEAAVTGLEDPEWGEIVVALVVVNSHADPDIHELTESIRADLRSKLEPSSLPKRIFPVKELTKTALGKIRRDELRYIAADLAGLTPLDK